VKMTLLGTKGRATKSCNYGVFWVMKHLQNKILKEHHREYRKKITFASVFRFCYA